MEIALSVKTITIKFDDRCFECGWYTDGTTVHVQCEFGTASEGLGASHNHKKKARKMLRRMIENGLFGGTPENYLDKARDFRDCVRELMPTCPGWEQGHAAAGTRRLIGDAFELSLKAVWLAEGARWHALKDAGHDLTRLLEGCNLAGVADEHADLVRRISPFHKRRDFMYVNRTGVRYLPPVGDLVDALDAIIALAEPVCREAMMR